MIADFFIMLLFGLVTLPNFNRPHHRDAVQWLERKESSVSSSKWMANRMADSLTYSI
jgi:hypothetical protein